MLDPKQIILDPDPKHWQLMSFFLHNKQHCLTSVFDSCFQIAEKNNEKHMLDPEAGHAWQNPSKRLVDMAVEK